MKIYIYEERYKFSKIMHEVVKNRYFFFQSVPVKKAWTDEEAQMAILVEREYNKLFKNHSLKIKFPDQELNREIVSKFHPAIETVYFQQPSNPRFCFVTLTVSFYFLQFFIFVIIIFAGRCRAE